MLSSINLTAFKAFDELRLTLGNLTLLSGINSAGKSSVLQALSLVRQSFDAAMLDQGTRNELLLNGPLVELGTVADIYCEYARRKPATITFGFHGREADESVLLTGTGVAEELKADVLRLDPGTHIAVNSATAFLRNPFNYLRADRVSPELTYPRSHREVVQRHSLGARGEFTAHYLSHYRDELVLNRSVRAHEAGPRLMSQVTHWMGKISPGVRIEPEAIAKTDFVTVRFGFGSRTGLTSSESYRPTHVGFGLTYTLPIIVALVSTPPGGMILVENPEAHVHPSGQAMLGRLMCLAAAGGAQVLVETHSDHVLNGVRIAAKEGVIDRDRLRLHFFVRGPAGRMDVESPVVEANGRLSRWPHGFFDQWDLDLDKLIE